MNAIKGIYKNGIVELLNYPGESAPTEVLVIFPDKKKTVIKVGGLYKDSSIDFKEMDKELKNLNLISEKEVMKDMKYK